MTQEANERLQPDVVQACWVAFPWATGGCTLLLNLPFLLQVTYQELRTRSQPAASPPAPPGEPGALWHISLEPSSPRTPE